MQNLLVVSLNNALAESVARDLSKESVVDFVNADTLIGNRLIDSIDFPLLKSNSIMESIEKIAIDDILLKDNQIIYMSNEMFVSNLKNELVQNSKVLFIEIKNNDKIINNIQELIKKHANMVISNEKIDLKLLKSIIF